MDDNIDEDASLRSKPSQERSCVIFINRSFIDVDVVWVDFNGGLKKYATLQHRQHFKVSTFVGHPWIFLRAGTKERLPIVTGTEIRGVMWPQPYPNGCQPSNFRAAIIIRPVYSLVRCCFHTLRESGVTKDNLMHLAIPLSLQGELQEFLTLLQRDD